MLGLVLQACPTALVRNLEEREVKLDSLRKNHNPSYLSKSVSYEEYTLMKKNKDTVTSSASDEIANSFSVNITNIDISNFPNKVEINVVVVDTNGVYLKNLAPPFSSTNYMEIWKGLTDSCSGKNSAVRDLNIEEIQSDNSPNYAIAFLLDHSGSMGLDNVNRLQQGVIELVQYLKESDMVSITKFTDKNYNSVDMTRDKFYVLDTFKVVGMIGITGHGTSYYDAVEEGIKQLENVPVGYEKIIIAFTDGGDGSSESTEPAVISQLLEKNIKLFNVGYKYADAELLKGMSDKTNGKFYMTISSKEFPYVLRDIYLKLSNYYKITYSTDDCRDTHNVAIPVSLPNSNSIIIGGASYRIEDVPIKKVGDIVFLNIEFEVGKSSITDPESLSEIKKIADWMNENPNHNILIKGHTDNSGEYGLNKELSLQRANSVRKELIKNGVTEYRIETKGFGDSAPIVPNDNEANRRKNRRTEIEIIR